MKEKLNRMLQIFDNEATIVRILGHDQAPMGAILVRPVHRSTWGDFVAKKFRRKIEWELPVTTFVHQLLSGQPPGKLPQGLLYK